MSWDPVFVLFINVIYFNEDYGVKKNVNYLRKYFNYYKL